MTPPAAAPTMNATGFGAAQRAMPSMPQAPDPMGELAGAQQGHEGMGQGSTGAMFGGMAGAHDGMTRAATPGGMEGGPLADLLAKIVPSLASLISGGGPGKAP